MDMWTSKIVELFGTIPIHARYISSKYIPRKSLFGANWSGGIIGPYFFQNEAGVAITVNGERYRLMISNFLWPKIDDMNIPTWRYVPHTACHDGHSARAIWGHGYLAQRRRELATEIVRFNAFRLLPLAILNRKSIRINRKQLMLSKSI